MPTWPVTLPQTPLEQAYEETMRVSQVRSSIDGLPIVQRQRSPGYAKPINLVLQMTSAQVDTFQSFYQTDLGHGAVSFVWTHPRTGVTVNVRCIGGQVPKTVPIGHDTYHVTCAAELMP